MTDIESMDDFETRVSSAQAGNRAVRRRHDRPRCVTPTHSHPSSQRFVYLCVRSSAFVVALI